LTSISRSSDSFAGGMWNASKAIQSAVIAPPRA
jgi:hypothetical protein